MMTLCQFSECMQCVLEFFSPAEATVAAARAQTTVENFILQVIAV